MVISCERLREAKKILQTIDKELNKLEKADPYGDIVENFEDMYRKRHTKRLIKMINKDLKKCR